MQEHCISISEHVWVVGRGGGGGGVGRGGWRVLPAGGIRASQGTFSSFCHFFRNLNLAIFLAF